jgi:hypothetical protein
MMKTKQGQINNIHWNSALGSAINGKPFVRSTMQLFRAHLIVHEKVSSGMPPLTPSRLSTVEVARGKALAPCPDRVAVPAPGHCRLLLP